MPYPKVGEVFELELDGDAAENQPLLIARTFASTRAESWKHNGPRVVGRQTRRFKLVKVGYCQNLTVAIAKLGSTTHQGQWAKAFKSAFPKADGQGPVGVADPSWVYPGDDYKNFLYVRTNGDLSYCWAGTSFAEHWRWLVPAE